MILNNLDEIYQEILEELSYRVGIVNIKDAYHFAIFNELLKESELEPYSNLLIKSLCEADDAEMVWVKKKDSGNIFQIQRGSFDANTHVLAKSGAVEKHQSKETKPKKAEKPKKQTKEEPTTKSLDDLKSVIAQKSIDKAAEDANDYINKINDNNLDKKALSNAFQKILNGDTLTDAEKALANDWISIRYVVDGHDRRYGGGNCRRFNHVAHWYGNFWGTKIVRNSTVR
jgi:hypothetical protein